MATIPAEYRNPIYHFRGPSAFPGPFTLTDQALSNYGVSRELFGSTLVEITAQIQFQVKDYQYALSKDAQGNVTSVGMNIIPVSSNKNITDGQGNSVPGFTLIDNLIREKQNLQPKDTIYALISYMHPELNKGTIEEFAKSDKAELGFTHLGAYHGEGVTSNSPVHYHKHRLQCTGLPEKKWGYPCNVHLVSLDGVDKNTFNRNCGLVDLLLGHGCEFPGAYKDSKFRPVYVNAALMFYRDWLFQEDYLRFEQDWFTYCAANKLTVLNIAANLPHNPAAFKEVYGDRAGEQLWTQFLARYHNATGFPFHYYPGLETDFVPLWKKEGLSAADITPFSKEEYDAYNKSVRLGTPYTGPTPTLPPKGVVCPPQTTADIVFEFEQLYADLYDAGAFTTIGVLWKFMPIVEGRMGISPLEYLSFALQVMQNAMFANAQVYAPAQPVQTWAESVWFWESLAILAKLFGATDAQLIKQGDGAAIEKIRDKFPSIAAYAKQFNPEDVDPAAVAVLCMTLVMEKWKELMKAGVQSREEAYILFIQNSRKIFELARGVHISNPEKIEYNALPAIFNLIANGLYDGNPLISVDTICTAVDVSEIQLKSK